MRRHPWTPSGGVLDPRELRRALAERPDWRVHGPTLQRRVRHRGFEDALAFVTRVVDAAEDFGRHPDVCLSGDGVVTFSVANPNHAGITLAELRLADKVDAAISRAGALAHA